MLYFRQPTIPKIPHDQGGGGIYASTSDFSQDVHELLFGSKAMAQLLRKSIIDTAFQPQLGAPSCRALQAVC